MQSKPVGWAVSSPPLCGFLSIFVSGTGSEFSVWLNFTIALVALPQRRGRDTATRRKISNCVGWLSSIAALAGSDFSHVAVFRDADVGRGMQLAQLGGQRFRRFNFAMHHKNSALRTGNLFGPLV